MKIHELPADPGARQKKKRVGRGHGSGHGKTSTRGHKGQASRSGGGSAPGFEGGQMPLSRRLPKFGFTNVFRTEYQPVNVCDLEKNFESGASIDRDALRKAGLIKGRLPVKLLGTGSLTKSFTIEVDKASESARQKITGAGGSVSEKQG